MLLEILLWVMKRTLLCDALVEHMIESHPLFEIFKSLDDFLFGQKDAKLSLQKRSEAKIVKRRFASKINDGDFSTRRFF